MPIPPPNPPEVYLLACSYCKWDETFMIQPSILQKLKRLGLAKKPGIQKLSSLPASLPKTCPDCGATVEASIVHVHY